MKKPRILVIKHGALGDLVQGFDAFAGLRSGLPEAHITLLTSPPFADLSRRAPWFDDVAEDPRAPAFNLSQMLRMRRFLQEGWDMILDLQCSRRTARYHQFLTPSATRWFGNAPGASNPYPDFTGVNNADRMKVAIEMAGAVLRIPRRQSCVHTPARTHPCTRVVLPRPCWQRAQGA